MRIKQLQWDDGKFLRVSSKICVSGMDIFYKIVGIDKQYDTRVVFYYDFLDIICDDMIDCYDNLEQAKEVCQKHFEQWVMGQMENDENGGNNDAR